MDETPKQFVLHRLLLRQLKRHLGVVDDIPADLKPFLQAVNEAYSDYDSDNRRLDRAIEMSSQELFKANTELVGVLRALPDLLFRVTPSGLVTDLRQHTGMTAKAVIHNLISEPTEAEDRLLARQFWGAVGQVRESKQTDVFEFEEVTDGECRHYEARLVLFLENDIIGIVRDITPQKQAQSERRKAEDRVRWQAYHDTLTGLPNRIMFQQRLDEAIESAKYTGERIAVLFLDLDRFKNVNDTLGHSIGDELLQRVSERFDTCLGAGMLLSRMGGDEFTVVIPNLKESGDAKALARQLLATLDRPFTLSGREVFIGGSVGISVYPDNGKDCQSLLQHADIAMYTVKGTGGGAVRQYSQLMDSRIEDRVALETALRRGMERDELVLHYQPQVDLKSGAIVGVEALVRWNHPELGLVPPGKFIPIAEETGLILRLGEWVMNEACRQAREWELRGYPIRVAVNVFARQFEQIGLADQVAKILKDTGLNPELLDLELTESALIRNCDSVRETLEALRAIGVRSSLDDFGTGYSSLSYLRRLPINMLKIDRSFIQELDGDVLPVTTVKTAGYDDLVLPNRPDEISTEAKIIHAVIEVAHALNLITIAEGVETQYQLQTLQRLGCDLMQGFLFSKPLPVSELEVLMGMVGGAQKAA